MNWFTGFVLYACIWSVTLFMVLPLGVRPHEDKGFGTEGSAPENPRIKRKMLQTTLASAVVWVIVWALIRWKGGL
jgi:predicted secreted protein